MKIHRRGRPAIEFFFVTSTIIALFSCCIGTLPFTIQPDEVATVAGKAFTYKLAAAMTTHPGYTFKFHAPGSRDLPSWLDFDAPRNLLLGVPSSKHDKGSHTIQLDVIHDETNKTADTINFLTIEVVEYEEDLNHFKILRKNTLPQPSKNSSRSTLGCSTHTPVIVATLLFDLTSRKLSGSKRVELLNSVSKWTEIDVNELRWLPGKGDKTAFNLHDVVGLTAGPGLVKDAQERGVSVSWKIGCGNSITGNERIYVSVSHLKFASQSDGFKKNLGFPVVAWHVSYGQVKQRHVVRVRRQALAQTPVPTSAFVTPTASVVTQIIGTPSIPRSPTAFTVTPTVTRIVPSPTRMAIHASATSVVPNPVPTAPPIKNTPPYLQNPINSLTAELNVQFVFQIPANTFHDDEEGATPFLKLDMYDPLGNLLPDDFWLNLDPQVQVLRGTPTKLGVSDIALIVTDREGLKSRLHHVQIHVVQKNQPPSIARSPTAFTVTQTVTRIVPSPTRMAIPSATPVVPSPVPTAPPENTPPYINKQIKNLIVEINVQFEFRIPPDTFHDKEQGATPFLKLDMYDPDGNPLPNDFWLSLDPLAQVLRGKPTELNVSYIALIVTDREGLKSRLHHVQIRVVEKNQPPLLYNHIDLIELYIDQPVVFPVPVDTFHDKEDGPTPQLRLTMSKNVDYQAFDSWVEFDAKSQTIYALPHGNIIGRHVFFMTAEDSGGKKAIDAFEIHVKPAAVKPNYHFGLVLDAPFENFNKSVTLRVKLCVQIGDYFAKYFNTSYKDIRVGNYAEGSVRFEWSFANIATNLTAVKEYEVQYVIRGEKNEPVLAFKNHMKSPCAIAKTCSVTRVYVDTYQPLSTTQDPNVVVTRVYVSTYQPPSTTQYPNVVVTRVLGTYQPPSTTQDPNVVVTSVYVGTYQPPSTTQDPNVVGKAGGDDDGTWWEYTIIPAFVVAAVILIIGLIVIVCIRRRRRNRLETSEKVVFVQRKKPAVFREEYPLREAYGNQPLITPNEKAALPPPAHPRSSTPTEDPSELLLSDSSPSYQPPFDSGHEPAGSSRPPVASYRLSPPYVAP